MLLKGPVLPSLLRFTVPILFSLFLQALYGAVDLWMVGIYADKADVSAVTTGSQTLMIVNALVIGLSVGVTISLGQAIGRGRLDRAARLIGTALVLFSALGLILASVLFLAAPTLTLWLNAPESAVIQTREYIRICGAGAVFIVGFNLLSAIFTGLGDSRTPLLFVGVATVVNILADYTLIHIFSMGAQGAAYATILAQALSVVLALFIIGSHLPFTLCRHHVRFNAPLAARIIKLGSPIALQNACNEISYLLIIGFVNLLGVVASSGVGIAEKLVMFILLIPTAFMYAISAFTAQNVGAGRLDRADQVLKLGLLCSGLIGAIAAYFSIFHGQAMASLFIHERAVIADAAVFLKTTAIECFILSLAYCFVGYFTGLGRTGWVLFQGMVAIFCVRIPYAYWASHQSDPSLFNIGLSLAFAAATMLIICSVLFVLLLKSRKPIKAAPMRTP